MDHELSFDEQVDEIRRIHFLQRLGDTGWWQTQGIWNKRKEMNGFTKIAIGMGMALATIITVGSLRLHGWL